MSDQEHQNSQSYVDPMDVDENEETKYLREEIKELELKCADLEANLKRTSNELNDVSIDRDNNKTKADENEDRYKEFYDKYNKSEEDYSGLRTKFSKIYTENNSLQTQLNISEKNLETLRIENEKLKTQLNKSEESLTKLRTENEGLKNEKNDLGTQLSKSEKDLKKLHAENEELKNEKNHLGTQLSKSESLNKRLKNKQPEYIWNDYDKQKSKIEKLSKKNDQFTSEIKTKNDEISALKDKVSELERNLQNRTYNSINENVPSKLSKRDSGFRQPQNQNEEHDKVIEELNSKLHKMDRDKQDLIKKNSDLKKEASQYQSALGSVTNYRMDDDDKNHSVQLKRDIENLQYLLKNYITTLKGDYFEINYNAVNDLMKKYKIDTKVKPDKPNKPLIKAVLQYHILRKIKKDMNKYLRLNSEIGTTLHLEAEIESRSKALEDKLAEFSESRKGTDTISQAASIKIRQEVNIALGNRGFSDILDGKGVAQEHVFIIIHKNELNKEMNKYRIIKDDAKRKSVEKMAPDLIREIVRIIYFRLKVQEPIAQMRWIPIDSKIDLSIMEGNWDKDEIDNLLVEVCSFPMIGRDLDDVEKRKIYIHAQVFTKKKTYKSFVTKGFDYFKSTKTNTNSDSELDEVN